MIETAAKYREWTKPYRDNPTLLRRIVFLNKTLTILGYIAYPSLLLLLFFLQPNYLLRAIVVPGSSFILVSIFRYVYNAPRPYEILEISPLIDKKTKGKSFPSRHTFCMFMIAISWQLLCIPAEICLVIAACFMAYIRVICGVHFPRDVIAGAIFGIVLGEIGFLFIPW